ncbi:CBS domain-containing protein [Flavimarina sp. Hel_I_48]|uniref:CBS domain-containing protein n=1 Tax=Flavimarina sp. Hel_I_48 TaxID=1392488 RepID=UPI0004DFAA96|nr:CBS domain-containing protein [Flavimarina sp. Hel_I_48]
MTLTDYIINDIAPLTEKSKMGEAQELFSQTTYSHIPVMREEVYLGCLAENDVHCHEADEHIDEQTHLYEGFFIRERSNWLNTLEAFGQNETNIMPVLDSQNRYLGYYELKDVMNYFNQTPFLSEEGTILVLEKGIFDYSFSEISQIVESNEGKILGAFISKFDQDMVQLSLKVGGDVGLNALLQSFRRYGYEVISEHQEDSYLIDLRERSDYLEKYLNI